MLKKVFYNGLAELTPVGVGFVSSVLLTRALGPIKWGHYSQASWLIDFCAAFLSFGLTYAAARFLAINRAAGNDTGARTLVLWMTVVQCLLALVGAGLLALLAGWLTTRLNWSLQPGVVRAAAIGVFAMTMLQLARGILRGLQEFRKLSGLAIMVAAVSVVAVVVTLAFPSVTTLIMVLSVGQILLLPWVFRTTMRTFKGTGTPIQRRLQLPDEWRLVIQYSATVFLTMLLDQIVWQRSEMFFLSRLPDAKESGYYSLAFTIARVSVTTMPLAITGILTPMFASLTLSEQPAALASAYRESVSLLGFLLLPTGIAVFALAPGLIAVLYGPAYVEAAAVLRILVLSAIMMMYARPSSSVMHALNRPRLLFLTDLVALPVDLILAWWLVGLWQARGAAIANLAANVVAGGARIVWARLRVGLAFDLRCTIRNAFGACVCGVVTWQVSTCWEVSAPTLALAVIVGATAYIISMLVARDPVAYRAVNWVLRQCRRQLAAQ
ncbi:MAG: hypothetical protein FJ026_09795 [Chloroflexi bacterium]|nr:hypothetical protein [Chloroflexota bacterium]